MRAAKTTAGAPGVVARRKHRTVAQRREVVEAYERSGLSQAEICAREGVRTASLANWRRLPFEESAKLAPSTSWGRRGRWRRACGCAWSRARTWGWSCRGVDRMLPPSVRVFLCTQPTDMRKSFEGLIAATKAVIGADPLSGHLFGFVNRQANYAKVLYWSRGGYCLWAKRLERRRFAGAAGAGVAVPMTDTEFMMWLDGIELRGAIRRKRFALPEARGAAAMMLPRQ